MTEDETVGCHHQFYGHPFEQTLGIGTAVHAVHGVTKRQTQLSD